MRPRSHRRTFSYYFLALTFFLYLFNYITDGAIALRLSLDVYAVSIGSEYWRLFSYPLVSSSYEGNLLFFITFYLFGTKLEMIFKRRLYALLLVLLVFLQGVLLTLYFWGNHYKFQGMEGISIFVLLFFTFLNFNKKLSFSVIKYMRVYLLTALMLLGWALSVSIHYSYTGDASIIVQSAPAFIFGSALAIAVFSQIRITQMVKGYNHIQNENEFRIHRPDELSLAMVSQNEIRKANQANTHQRLDEYEEFIPDENRLNEILDKIIVGGSASLSESEKAYLKNYSNNLQ